jgi:hypothetical protein
MELSKIPNFHLHLIYDNPRNKKKRKHDKVRYLCKFLKFLCNYKYHSHKPSLQVCRSIDFNKKLGKKSPHCPKHAKCLKALRDSLRNCKRSRRCRIKKIVDAQNKIVLLDRRIVEIKNKMAILCSANSEDTVDSRENLGKSESGTGRREFISESTTELDSDTGETTESDHNL